MDHKQLLLHELLQQDQEPFHLKTYIFDKRSQLRNSSPPTAAYLSPCGGAFLHIPSRTADVLLEAAAKIQKQRSSKSNPQIKSVGLCFLGSLLKILKNRSRKRVLRGCDLTEKENSEEIRISCSCDSLSRDDQLRASTSSQRPELFYEIGGFEHCSSPFRSPAASPTRRVKQEKEDCEELHPSVNGVEEEKEQCSPVSVLDTFFEDDAQESLVEEEDDDDDLEQSYANIERARQQLLDRLRRFEKLLDPVDLEQKLLEASDELGVESEEDEDMKRASLKQSPVKMMMMKKCFFDHKEAAFAFKAEFDEWRRTAEVAETAAEVELAIFGGLMEELSDDLLCNCMDVTTSPFTNSLVQFSFTGISN